MTDQNEQVSGTKYEQTPLVRRLREVGFIVSFACLRPTPERLGELHLHGGEGCSTMYCVPCEKPLFFLEEIVPHEPEFEYESEVEINDLCLVCAYCGVVYHNNLMEDVGVLHHIVVERGNLIEALKVFDGVPAEGREHVAIACALDETEALLKQGLESVSTLRSKLASGELTSKPTPKKGGRVLSLVVDPPVTSADQEPDPGPSAA
ncbi:MAG: hypothetical protein WC866_04750 [Patescibacteria group bacterium]